MGTELKIEDCKFRVGDVLEVISIPPENYYRDITIGEEFIVDEITTGTYDGNPEFFVARNEKLREDKKYECFRTAHFKLKDRNIEKLYDENTGWFEYEETKEKETKYEEMDLPF